MVARFARPTRRPGITLTEILIAILILGVGLASVATLFPLGLLRLREAARSTRSAYLSESAAADLAARGLLTSGSFSLADQYNVVYGSSLNLGVWFSTANNEYYNPLTQDTPGFYQDWSVSTANGTLIVGANSPNSGGYGLPFAYDPLWRFQTQNPNTNTTSTQGYYFNDNNKEARFGSGIGFIRDDNGIFPGVASAHGLQRLTNFNRPYVLNNNTQIAVMPVSNDVPKIFVSPEDVVWVENVASSQFSPVLPDLSLAADPDGTYATTINDWHYSWMFTGQQNNNSSGSIFDGNIVIFENRPFAIDNTVAGPNTNIGSFQSYQVEGETVVEAIWGYSDKVSG